MCYGSNPHTILKRKSKWTSKSSRSLGWPVNWISHLCKWLSEKCNTGYKVFCTHLTPTRNSLQEQEISTQGSLTLTLSLVWVLFIFLALHWVYGQGTHPSNIPDCFRNHLYLFWKQKIILSRNPHNFLHDRRCNIKWWFGMESLISTHLAGMIHV